MKRTKKKMNNKGFTLVELIVVLVILAILAAILVPTLMGYINKAREEKDFSTAQAVRVATQSIVAEMYGKTSDPSTITGNAVIEKKGNILKLIGADSNNKVDGKVIDITKVKLDTAYQIEEIAITIDGKYYYYSTSDNNWLGGDEAKTKATATTQ